VDGRIAELGDRVDALTARVTVDGVPIPAHPELRHFAFNKPAGVTSTLRDRHAERTLEEFLPRGPRVVPVGRLDRDTEGLLLLTNDGGLANRLQHPRYGVEKEYLVEVEGSISRKGVRRLLDGVLLEDGPARALRVHVVDRGPKRSAISVVMGEGRKREVRRMLSAVGFPVRRLARVRFGPIRLGELRPGAVRALDPAEVGSLYRIARSSRAEPGAGAPEPDEEGARGPL
jgi:23S rRNA pseudouridine2605 synthase